MTEQKACEEAVVQAIHAGYRLIDTAAAYGTVKRPWPSHPPQRRAA